ncbi:MAG: Holliday junction resolvase RuvX [Prevotellaceae bacterium]|jgi:putative Holliday junction resolvase|nr:Holliday junction resolvase RuvX [Prevotellaceae bacterium]
MGRILSIDYGKKRVGIAVSDPLKIIATALDTVPESTALNWIEAYLSREPVELFVIGLPMNLNGSDAELMPDVKRFARRLEKFNLPVAWVDERFTSKMAMRAMVDAGVRKSQRRKKENTDKISAVIILQTYLQTCELQNINK